MKCGFIGAGNMGGAIIKGLVVNKAVDKKELFFFETSPAIKEERVKELGIVACESTKELIEKSNVVFLAVKPNILPTVLQQNKEYFKENSPLVISMAAGVELNKIKENIGYEARIMRIMPNMNAHILKSTTAFCRNNNVTDEEYQKAQELLFAIGSAFEVEESKFGVFSAIASCSPAYVYMFINSLAQAALKEGMPKATALKIAADAVAGSALMLSSKDVHPLEMADKVCSPAGTTIEGVLKLTECGFENAVMKAVSASVEKDRMLGK
ncbi:MAG: pyrroline-5-carboxylate reductase [Firmicutes bacterium]|nr:pyrroline-5-carboxylate reductase [Bacillota bacterium]